MQTKADYMPDVDWDAMPYATRIRLTLKDGRVLELSSFDYWPTKQVDLVVGGVEEVSGDERRVVGFREIPLPNPAVESIEIMKKGSEVNRPGRPEHAYAFPRFKDIYKETWGYADFNLGE